MDNLKLFHSFFHNILTVLCIRMNKHCSSLKYMTAGKNVKPHCQPEKFFYKKNSAF